MLLDELKIAKELISAKSETPDKGKGLRPIAELLNALGFETRMMKYGDGKEETANLYAEYGDGENNLLFLGHSDVVPAGDTGRWATDPYLGTILRGNLYGRGAVDMKGAIACYIVALAEFIEANPRFSGKLSLLITGDEEGKGTNGTSRAIDELISDGKKFSSCLVGEPTSVEKVGDMIKIGRRGSISLELRVIGIQGHVAYPELAENPINKLLRILIRYMEIKFDEGSEYFAPTHLEITDIEVGNRVTNIIPSEATGRFNIRFNDLQDPGQMVNHLYEIAKQYSDKCELRVIGQADVYLNKKAKIAMDLSDAIYDVTGLTPEFSTDGGTSDGRFIYQYCPVIEFGLKNATAHKVNESVSIEELKTLKTIYSRFLEGYFKKRA